MNSVTDMVLQNSIHPHPGIGAHLNHALTGNQSQTAQGFKGLNTYSGYWHLLHFYLMFPVSNKKIIKR